MIKFKYGELFCGPGGMALGAKMSKITHKGQRYGLAHAWANDIDEDSCKTYAKNICPSEKESITALPVDKYLTSKRMKSLEPIDIFAYGFPCNDFSLVGERKGINGKFGPLYSYGVKVLNYFRPKVFVAENVGGIASSNSGMAFKKICDDLQNAGNGYVITKHKYRSELYSVPQLRHRIIIVGIDQSLGLKFQVPVPLNDKDSVISASEAIGNGAIPSDSPNNEEYE